MLNPVVSRQGTGRSGDAGICLRPVFFSLLLGLLLSRPGYAGAEVSAMYTQARGTLLAMEINIGTPPPSSLILVQNLPPGVTLLDAQPPANNVNPGKGEAKWLLRDIAAGRFTIRMTLDRPVATGDISAEIRFMPAQGGGMQTLPVAKP